VEAEFQLDRSVSNPVLTRLSDWVRVIWPVVAVVTFDEEENFVASDQEVCPLPPTQSVCIQGEEAT
jgi:hypothetical protein